MKLWTAKFKFGDLISTFGLTNHLSGECDQEDERKNLVFAQS